MKRILLALTASAFLVSCGNMGQIVKTTDDILKTLNTGITSDEASSGLKEALEVGVNNGTSFLGKTDGFLSNAAYKIFMPKEVKDVEQKIKGNLIANALAGPYMDKLVTAMNRGAENAMAEAKPIFVNAIKSMTIKDAINIVTGGDGAGTAYLQRVTSAQLTEKFTPVIKTSLDKVNINEPWTKVSKGYNIVTGKSVTTDLNAYVTEKSMTALFTQVKQEEDKIRANPIARTTEILKKVFSYADQNKK